MRISDLIAGCRLFPALLCLFLAPAALAVEPAPGGACSTAGAVVRTGGPETSGVGNVMVCQGGTWKSALGFDASAQVTKIGNLTCAATDVLEFDGTKWVCGAAAAGDNLGDHTATTTLTMGSNAAQFGSVVGDKIRWYSNTYGTGIESNTLTNWSANTHRWRIGGTSVSTGTEYMYLNAAGLNVAGDLTITGNDLFMATNTAGYLLIADGTNYNPTAVTGDVTITGAGVTAIGADKVLESMLKAVNAPTDEYCLTYESTTGDFEWQACGGGGATLNGITAATASQAGIANGAYTIQWNWDSLAGGSALKLASTSTAAAGNAQKMFEVALSGANATAGQSTYGIYASNAHTGATSGNYGVYGSATGGTDFNYGVYGTTSSTVSGATGVLGIATGGTGDSSGVVGQTNSVTDGSSGVFGNASQATGATYGGYFSTQSATAGATGVFGTANAASGATYGVSGRTNGASAGAAALYGFAAGATGATYGVYALNHSSTGYGGYFTNDNGGYALATGSGNAGIGTNAPASLLHVGTGGYAQFEKTFAGAPTGTDCDAAAELGRVTVDTTNGRWYVCTGTGGWKYTTIGTSGGAGDNLGNHTASANITLGTYSISRSGSSGGAGLSFDASDNAVLSGDLTVTGNDIVMGTNTAAMLLIADGTNFSPTTLTGDVTIDNGLASKIGDNKILEAMLKAVDAPADEECLTYETTTGDFEWQSCGGGGGATVYNAGSSTSIDWNNGTTQYTTANCGAFTLSNMADGGAYTLIVQGATAATCSFSHTGLTVKLPPGHGATTASKHTLYSFARAGSNVYVSWIKGY